MASSITGEMRSVVLTWATISLLHSLKGSTNPWWTVTYLSLPQSPIPALSWASYLTTQSLGFLNPSTYFIGLLTGLFMITQLNPLIFQTSLPHINVHALAQSQAFIHNAENEAKELKHFERTLQP